MSTAAEAAKAPRTRNRLRRRSLLNTSYPVRAENGLFHQFLRYGRVPLDVHERVPEEKIKGLAAQMSAGRSDADDSLFTYGPVEALLIDAEVAVYHYAADTLSAGESDLSPELIGAAEKLAIALEAYGKLAKRDSAILRSFVRVSHKDLAWALHISDDLDPYTLRSAIPKARIGRKKGAHPAIAALMQGFIDDWERRTALPVTYAKSPGSAHYFYVSAIELMCAYPPHADSACEVHATAAKLLPDLRRGFDKPWRLAVRSAAGG